MEKFFSAFDLAKPEALVTRTLVDPTPRATRRRAKLFFRDDVEREDIFVDSEMLPKSLRKEQFVVTKSKATKKANTWKPDI